MYTVENGWIVGSLPGRGGKTFQVRHFKQPSYVKLSRTPNLVLHTTETDGYIENLQYPTQFQVGEGFIGQHKPLWARGEGTDTQDAYAMQVEIVGRSKLYKWLPGPSSLEPLVALTAFLHKYNHIVTGVHRPRDWPIAVDYQGSCYPATDCYYRRKAGIWPTMGGVYGHLELPDDEHWDPGGFDYPMFFDMVRDVLESDDMTADEKARLTAAETNGRFAVDFIEGMTKRLKGGPQPAEAGARRKGWRHADAFLKEPANEV